MRWGLAFPLVLALSCTVACLSAEEAGLRVRAQIPIAGWKAGNTVHLDQEGRRLYVPLRTGIGVFDLKTLQKVGEVATPEASSVAVAPELKRGYAVRRGSPEVVFFDPETLAVTKSESIGREPDSVLHDAYSRRVFTVNPATSDTSVMGDPIGGLVEGEVLAHLPLKGKPTLAMSDGAERVYFVLGEKRQVVVVDPLRPGNDYLDSSGRSVVRRFMLPECEAPAALAWNKAGELLYVACKKQVFAVKPGDGKIAAALALEHEVTSIAWTSRGLILGQANPGALIVRPVLADGSFAPGQSIPMPGAVQTITADPADDSLYIPVSLPDGDFILKVQ